MEWLHQVGISTARDPVHDAAGINDDYPTGRGIFIEDTKEFVVLVNCEDHIEIVMTPPENERNLNRCFARMVKLHQTFEKIGFSSDSYLGSLTASPKNLGTGITISGQINVQKPEARELKPEIKMQIQAGTNCQITKTGGFLYLQSMQTLASNYNENL